MAYIFEHGFEEIQPQIAFRAQQIQGENYTREGFVPYSALDGYGRLIPETDRTRGKNVEYFLATAEPYNTNNQASFRLIYIPHGGKLDALPSWEYCANAMYAGARNEIREHFDKNGEAGVIEVAAFCRTNTAASLTTLLALLREVIHSRIRKGSNEKYIATIVNKTYDILSYTFGSYAVRRIGKPVAINPYVLVNDGLSLIPALLEPSTFLDDIVRAVYETEDKKQKFRMLYSLRFLCEGLPEREMSADVHQLLKSKDNGASAMCP